MSKQEEYKAIFDEYQRLKELHPFENKTNIIRIMVGKENKKEFTRIEHILIRVFNVKGDRYELQAKLENEVLTLWQKHRAENNFCVRQTAKFISGCLNIENQRVMNILYRNGCYGDFANSTGKKNVSERKKTGRKPQEHKVENDPNAWSGLFKDNVMQFSPAWYGKNIQAA